MELSQHMRITKTKQRRYDFYVQLIDSAVQRGRGPLWCPEKIFGIFVVPTIIFCFKIVQYSLYSLTLHKVDTMTWLVKELS